MTNTKPKAPLNLPDLPSVADDSIGILVLIVTCNIPLNQLDGKNEEIQVDQIEATHDVDIQPLIETEKKREGALA